MRIFPTSYPRPIKWVSISCGADGNLEHRCCDQGGAISNRRFAVSETVAQSLFSNEVLSVCGFVLVCDRT